MNQRAHPPGGVRASDKAVEGCDAVGTRSLRPGCVNKKATAVLGGWLISPNVTLFITTLDRQPLTDAEVEARRTALQQLARSSLAWRAFTYFMGCFACQTFWTAVVVFAFTRSVGDLVGCLFTAAAYSGAAVGLSSFGNLRGGLAAPERGKTGCADCGK